MEKAGILDMFGVAPAVNLNGKPKTYTVCGILFTISVLTITILMAIYFSEDMIYGKNPIVNQNLVHGALTDDMLTLDPKQFVMRFGLSSGHSYTYYVDPSIYTVRAQTWVGKDFVDPEAGCSQLWTLPLEVCTPTTGEGQLYCLGSKIPDMYKGCLKNKEQEDLFVIVNSQDIWVDFFKCVGPDCTTEFTDYASLDDFIEDGYIIIERTDLNVNTQNYTSPINPYIRLERFGIIASMYKVITFDLGVLDLITDDGWLMSSPKNTSVLYVDSLRTDMFRVPDLSTRNKFSRTYIFSSGNKSIYNRKYEKVQDVLAQINGVVAICIIIAGILAYPFARAKMYESVINDLYQVKIDSEPVTVSKQKLRKLKKKGKKNNKNFDNINPTEKINEEAMMSAQPLRPEANTQGYFFSPNNSMVTDTRIETNPQKTLIDKNHCHLTNVPSHSESCRLCDLNKRLQTLTSSPLKLQTDQSEPCQMDTLQAIQSSDNKNNTENQDLNPPYSPIYSERARITLEPYPPLPLTTKGGFKEEEEEEEKDEEDPSDFEQSDCIAISIEKRYPPLNVTFKNWLKSIFKPDPRVQALRKGTLEVMNHIDILTLINTKRELENLKKCVLTPHQRVLFDNLRKPTISVSTNCKYQAKIQNDVEVLDRTESFKGDKLKLKEAYRTLRKSKNKDEIDKRLLSLFERLEEGNQ